MHIKLKATGERIGSNIAVVAKLEVTSVKKLTIAVTISTKRITATPSKTVIWLAIQLAKPVSVNALANAIPPPKRMMMPQGILTASSQVSNFLPFLFLEGLKIRVVLRL